MAKDPAILFYTSDFLTGTFTMTDEQVGRYIKLLCLQHQKGHLTIKDLEFVCRGKDAEVFAKFEQDAEGCFFNKTLKEHSEKRKAYSDSRRKNLKGKKPHMDIHMEHHMAAHMENENENVIVIETKGGLGEKEKKRDGIAVYSADQLLAELQNTYWLQNVSMLLGCDHDTTLEKLTEFARDAEIKGKLSRALGDIKSHFYNWIKLKIQNGNKGKQSNATDRQERLNSINNMEDLAEKVLRGS